jgi:hypothetical protein
MNRTNFYRYIICSLLFVFLFAQISYAIQKTSKEMLGTLLGNIIGNTNEPLLFQLVILKKEGVMVDFTFSDTNGDFLFKSTSGKYTIELLEPDSTFVVSILKDHVTSKKIIRAKNNLITDSTIDQYFSRQRELIKGKSCSGKSCFYFYTDLKTPSSIVSSDFILCKGVYKDSLKTGLWKFNTSFASYSLDSLPADLRMEINQPLVDKTTVSRWEGNYVNNLKEGEWSYYYNGELVKKVYYKKGKIISEVKYEHVNPG